MKSSGLLTVLFILSLLALPQKAFGYATILSDAGAELHWQEEDQPVNFYIDKDGAPELRFSSIHQNIMASFTTWSNVECSSLSFEYKGTVNLGPGDVGVAEDYDERNVLIWIQQDQWPGEWTDAFAVTVPLYEKNSGRIVDADILLNKNFQWSVRADGELGKGDVQSIVTHE